MSVPVFDEGDFDAYCQEVEVYEQTWHTEPVEPQMSYLAARPKLKTELFRRVLTGKRILTNHLYAEGGIWSAERRDLQSEVIAKLSSDMIPAETAKESVYFLIGLPGSGKSSALRPLVLAHSGLESESVMISDADALRAEFPEYAKGLGSGVVQDECSELMYDRQLSGPEAGFQGAILNSGGVTIVDVIGSPDYLPPLIRRLRRLGRRVFVLQASCETLTCVSRAKSRALSTGRLVPPEVILAKDGIPEQTLEAVRRTGNPSGWAVVDTNGPEPRILDSFGFDLVNAA